MTQKVPVFFIFKLLVARTREGAARVRICCRTCRADEMSMGAGTSVEREQAIG